MKSFMEQNCLDKESVGYKDSKKKIKFELEGRFKEYQQKLQTKQELDLKNI